MDLIQYWWVALVIIALVMYTIYPSLIFWDGDSAG